MLAESFTSLVGKAQIIDKAANYLPDSDEKLNIISNCQDISSKMEVAIILTRQFNRRTSVIHVVIPANAGIQFFQ